MKYPDEALGELHYWKVRAEKAEAEVERLRSNFTKLGEHIAKRSCHCDTRVMGRYISRCPRCVILDRFLQLKEEMKK